MTEAVAPHIPMTPIQHSNQIAAIGYDAHTKRLAVRFTRGSGAMYHYPNVEPELHAQFMAAKSKGSFHAQHIKSLPFVKYEPKKA